MLFSESKLQQLVRKIIKEQRRRLQENRGTLVLHGDSVFLTDNEGRESFFGNLDVAKKYGLRNDGDEAEYRADDSLDSGYDDEYSHRDSGSRRRQYF